MLTQHDGISNGVKENYPCDGAGSPDLNPVLFQSREYDTDLGLYFNRARYYDPGIGRFTQRDLLRTNNRYVAFSNNPNYFFDPYGLNDCVYDTWSKNLADCYYVFFGTDNCNHTWRRDCNIKCEDCCFRDQATADIIFSVPLFTEYNAVMLVAKAVNNVINAFSPIPDCIQKCREAFLRIGKDSCDQQVDPGDNNGCPPDVPNCDEILY